MITITESNTKRYKVTAINPSGNELQKYFEIEEDAKRFADKCEAHECAMISVYDTFEEKRIYYLEGSFI